jgi:hypothetical protein
MTARWDRWIRRTTIGCVGMLALIVSTVSYLHMRLLVELHGSQPGWRRSRRCRWTGCPQREESPAVWPTRALGTNCQAIRPGRRAEHLSAGPFAKHRLGPLGKPLR